MSKEQAIQRARDIVLACPHCEIPTDYSFDVISNIWTTACDCGNMSKYSGTFVDSEVNEIIKEFNVIK